MKQTIRVIGRGREVYEWGENGEGDHVCGSDSDFLNCEFANEGLVDEFLDGHYGLPSLDEWSANPDIPGMYSAGLIENVAGMPDANGKYVAQYYIQVERLTIEPYSIGDDDDSE